MATSLLPSQPSEVSKCVLACAFPQPLNHMVLGYVQRAGIAEWYSLFCIFFFFFPVVVLQNCNMKVKQEPLAGVERNLLSRGEGEMPGRRQELGRAFFFQ